MENLQINFSPNTKTCTDRTLVCNGDNNELIFRKTYVGDWGDWDEKPEDLPKEPLYLDQSTSFTSAV